jgi:nucleoside-diphosphate-sugar epimerase
MSSATTGAVAVTGASGFIGRRLCRHLVAAGVPLRVHVRAWPRPGLPAGLDAGRAPVTGDLARVATWRELLAGCDAVIHLAGVVRGRRAADFAANWTWVDAFTAAAATGQPWLLFVSSLVAREPALSPYAESKHAAERRLGSYRRACILRPPAVYGPGDRELAPLFALLGRRIALVPAAPRARFSLLHVDDLCAAMQALLHVRPAGQTLSISDGTPGGYGWDDLARTAATLTGRAPHRLVLPATLLRLLAHGNLAASACAGRAPMLTPGKVNELLHADWTCGDEHVRSLTGWEPRVGLADGLAMELAAAGRHQH